MTSVDRCYTLSLLWLTHGWAGDRGSNLTQDGLWWTSREVSFSIRCESQHWLVVLLVMRSLTCCPTTGIAGCVLPRKRRIVLQNGSVRAGVRAALSGSISLAYSDGSTKNRRETAAEPSAAHNVALNII